MNRIPENRPAEPPDCLVRLVTEEMVADHSLEAVRIDRGTGSLQVATLGAPESSHGLERVEARLRTAADAATHQCSLLEGSDTCESCPRAVPPPKPNPAFRIAHSPGVTTIERVTCPTAPRFWRWQEGALPRFVPREVRLPEDEHAESEWKAQLAAAVVCGAAGLTGWFLGDHPGALVAFGVAYLAGAVFPAQEVLERLRERQLDVHFLMLAVAAGAASIGAWAEGAALLFLFSLSGALEHYALGRTHREIRSLFKSAPKEATTIDASGREIRRPVDQLQPGERLLVRPGELFPVDAEVVTGTSAADESNLTGEAVPVEKRTGDTLLAGTLNLWGALEAVVLRPASASALQRIVTLIREAQQQKAPSQRFTDRFGTGYTLGILGLTVAVFLGWWLVGQRPPFVSSTDARSAFYLAMTFLVVASPCALVLSIPSAILAAIARGARQGILFRGGAAVEKLADIEVVAMDKTGTLTTGDLRVGTVESFPPGRSGEVLQLAFDLERLSTHPLARALTRHGKQQGLVARAVEGLESVSGQGLRGWIGGDEVRLGRRAFAMEGREAEFAQLGDPGESTSAGAGSEVWVRSSGLAGRIVLHDALRPESGHVVEELRRQGLRSLVLTGDRALAARQLQEQLHVDQVRAELKPEEKVQAIVALSKEGRRVAMIGDGVNDAPAIAAAHVGVAMGARGSDAALEQADIVLMHDRLENFLAAFRLSRRARDIIRQNLLISLGTLVVLAVLALAGRVPLTQGVLGHEGSTVLVVLNSLRLLFRSPDRSPDPSA